MADGLLNKASIILTPTGYKAGTLYNVAPVVEPYEDFDFARASVASRVNSSGLVEILGRTLGSELIIDGDFPNGDNWNEGSSWTIADNKATAISNGYLIQSNVIPSSSTETYKLTYTISNSNDANLKLAGGSNPFGTQSIPDEDGTYTLYVVANGTTARNLQFFSNGFRGDISNVSLKQLIDTNNIPRISYDSNGDNGHFLLEPTSRNLVPYSENFEGGSWGNASVGTKPTLEGGYTAPDGTDTAYKISNANQNSFWYYPSVSDTNYARTIWARTVSGTGTAQLLAHNSNTNNTFNLTETWQRFEINTVVSVGQENLYAVDFRGDGTLTELLIWGAQSEALSYATSYIPTLTGSTVTRATETANGAGSADLINSTEGVLYAEIAALDDDDLNNRRISLAKDGDNKVNLVLPTVSNTIQGIVITGGVVQFNKSFVISNTVFNKIAIKYKVNDFALWINGVEVATDTSGNTFSSGELNQLVFNNGNGNNPFYGKCKAVAVFNEALSDAELNNLTG